MRRLSEAGLRGPDAPGANEADGFTAEPGNAIVEFVGVIGLIMGGLLGFMIAFYLWRTRLKHAEDPSDNPVGDIDDISGDYGFFSPYSWWPLWLGLSAAICFLGLAVGWWVFAIGAFFAVPALVGWTFEYWKGEHAL